MIKIYKLLAYYLPFFTPLSRPIIIPENFPDIPAVKIRTAEGQKLCSWIAAGGIGFLWSRQVDIVGQLNNSCCITADVAHYARYNSLEIAVLARNLITPTLPLDFIWLTFAKNPFCNYFFDCVFFHAGCVTYFFS